MAIAMKPPEYWDKQRKPLTADAWVKKLIDPDYRRIADYSKGDLRVLTEWMGFEHSHDHIGRPLIFRTLVYVDATLANEVRWYATEPEAAAGHVDVCMKREGRLM
jgi:hypothetical protein